MSTDTNASTRSTRSTRSPGSARAAPVLPHRLTLELAAHSLAIAHGDTLPASVSRIARHSLLDWFAVACAAWQEPPVQILLADIRDEGATPRATLLDGSRASAVQAALVNGTASHVLDFDDAHLQSRVHPSVPLWPAILAQAEAGRHGGAAALAAFAAGVELQSRVASLMGEDHYRLGWHNTATLGTLGATTAVAALLGLDTERTAHALGIACTQAGGLRALFGTMGKPLHAGHAAAIGLRAARLAARGFTAVTDILEREQGFAALYAGQWDADRVWQDAATPRVHGIVYKYHASCYGTQAPIDACLQLRQAHAFQPGDIEMVDVAIEPQYLDVCCIANPCTPSEAKFSIAHMAALALSGRSTVAAGSFADARDDPAISALRARIRVQGDAAMPRANARATVTLTDGCTHVSHCDASRPETDLDRQEARIASKARALLAPVLGEARAEALIATALACEGLDDVAACFAPLRR
ncbi:MmgE/PrpD family protein [Cupriavidus pauculus]|uniref:MmgE/PrpD family protein n=1 Tax=Cupriavidus pauculus TaxID=82633 RepID=A0A2N5CEB0_9BURK|nr:MmgE/PrpD family protein [Cupriavidus pauculus]PLQ00522.1 MmgE/PrpD family protein [Cupriavidus pauculus]